MMTSGYNISELVQEAQTRWLKPPEVNFILKNYDNDQLTHEPPQKPPSGSLFLFNKRVLRFFRKDGHSWRRKRDGRTVGEAHERLKVGNVEALNCYYAHGELNPNFQRRSYWMLDPAFDHIVLVHYRDIHIGRTSAGTISTLSSGSSSTFVQSPSSYTIPRPHSAAIVSEICEPYEDTCSPNSVEVSSDVVIKGNGTSHLDVVEITGETNSSPEIQINQALRRLEEQLSLNDDSFEDIGPFYGENENSNDSVYTANEQAYSRSAGMQYGSNSYVSQHYSGDKGELQELHQYQQQFEAEFTVASNQTVTWKEMPNYNGSSQGVAAQENYVYRADANDIFLPSPGRETVKEQEGYHSLNFGANNDSSTLLPQEVEDFKFPAYSPTLDMYRSDADYYSTVFDQGPIGAPLSSLTMAEEQKFSIREISPEWGYASEPTKVIIIGNFCCDPSNCAWTCMFGDIEVPAEIIQEGVFCCMAPPCLPGKVTLCITSGNRESCSEIREFEYRVNPNGFIQNNLPQKEASRSSEELLLLVRFVQMLLSNPLAKSEKNAESGVDQLSTSKAGEDSWGQVIEALLVGASTSSSTTDWLLQELLKDKLQQWLSSRSQGKEVFPHCPLSKREQGLIHMVSALGFGWALNPILNCGVGVNFRDINGWTALHWAARFGREKMVAELLASGASAGAVTDPNAQDPTGKTPASIAATFGHKGLAGYLSEVALTSHLSSLTLEESELSRSSADVEAERTVNTISNTDLVTNEDQLSLKDTLAAVRNAAQAAARIQSAFRAHSFRKRRQQESAYASGDEYGFLSTDIEGLSAASKLAFRNARDHNAALSIQKKFRGWKGRKDFLAFRQKVVKIQAYVRGHQVRNKYKVICWATGVLEKVILRWRRKGVGLRGYRQEPEPIDVSEDEDVVKVFRKQKVDVAIDQAVSRVLSMVESQEARQQYRRMLERYRQAKAERGEVVSEAGSTSQGDLSNVENDGIFKYT